jgi:hypothetical protein
MALDTQDMQWMVGQFAEVRKDLGEQLLANSNAIGERLQRHKNELTARLEQYRGEVLSAQKESNERLEQVSDDFRDHRMGNCQLMKQHVDEKHNLGKTLGLIALVSGIAVGAFKALVWLLSVKETMPW